MPIKILLAQVNTIIGDTFNGLRQVEEALGKAALEDADVVVFPELLTTGYPPRDLLLKPDFILAASLYEDMIVFMTKKYADITVVFGSIYDKRKDEGAGVKGNRLHNVALAARNGDRIAMHKKMLLPTYDVFDEARHFSPGTPEDIHNAVFEVDGMKFGMLVCEDTWNSNDFKGNYPYTSDPVKMICDEGIDTLITINASPFRIGIQKERLLRLTAHAEKNKINIVYCNQVGGNDELVFDGGSFAVSSCGAVLLYSPLFETAMDCLTLENGEHDIAKKERGRLDSESDSQASQDDKMVFESLTLAMKDYVGKMNFNGPLIIGLSGGIDSALVAAIVTEAVGSDRVIGITMPSEFSSDGSVSDAEVLASNLGIRCMEIPINGLHNEFRKTIDETNDLDLFENITGKARPLFELSGVADENIQARIRGSLLMCWANWMNGMVISTGNKSEMAVGYCTLYGDMNGGYALLCDVPKLRVYSVSRWYNEYRNKQVIPLSTIQKEPSAELSKDQKDSDSLPEYWLLDRIISCYIDDGISVEEIPHVIYKEIEKVGHLVPANSRGDDDPKEISLEEISKHVNWTCHRIDAMEFKRRQSPIGPKITQKDLRRGRQVPIVYRF